MFISGSLNGNERLGAQIVFYLIEYLVSNYRKDETITNLLKNREIIFVPMPNAYGFAMNTRQERIGNKSYDPLQDFPFSTAENKCMNTIAARNIYRLFQDNVFVTAINFHSSGFYQAIAFPWGSNHFTEISADGALLVSENPDLRAFEALGRILVEESGDGDEVVTDAATGDDVAVKYYKLGASAQIFYPMEGAL